MDKSYLDAPLGFSSVSGLDLNMEVNCYLQPCYKPLKRQSLFVPGDPSTVKELFNNIQILTALKDGGEAGVGNYLMRQTSTYKEMIKSVSQYEREVRTLAKQYASTPNPIDIVEFSKRRTALYQSLKSNAGFLEGQFYDLVEQFPHKQRQRKRILTQQLVAKHGSQNHPNVVRQAKLLKASAQRPNTNLIKIDKTMQRFLKSQLW